MGLNRLQVSQVSLNWSQVGNKWLHLHVWSVVKKVATFSNVSTNRQFVHPSERISTTVDFLCKKKKLDVIFVGGYAAATAAAATAAAATAAAAARRTE